MITKYLKKYLQQVEQPARFKSLDGWRGISILLVLAAHLLPLGPKSWELNATFGAAGMAIFFILSGFLITNILLNGENISHFIIKRLARIVPLAWLILFISLLLIGATHLQWINNFIFIANWPPISLTTEISHFWSLSLEVQFYFIIAFLFLVVPKQIKYIIFILAISTTTFRIIQQVPIAINTYYRIDEILAGSILALIFNSDKTTTKNIFSKTPTFIIALLLLMSSSPKFEMLNYLRPYMAMIMVASTLFGSEENFTQRLLNIKILVYIATISYALYVIHGGLRHTWLGSGETLEKYIKRPLLLIFTFVAAHISTKYYESYFQNKARKLIDWKFKKTQIGNNSHG